MVFRHFLLTFAEIGHEVYELRRLRLNVWRRFILSASSLISGNANLSMGREDVACRAPEDDQIVIHAHEERRALFWIRMGRYLKELVVAGVFWDLRNEKITGFSISSTAGDAILIKNVTFIAWEINSPTNHAHEEILTVSWDARYTKELIATVKSFCVEWRKRECNQSQSNIYVIVENFNLT